MLSILFPRKCVFCGSILEGAAGAMACAPCSALVRTKYRANRHINLPALDDGMAALRYAGPVKTAIKRYKFHHNKSAARYFAAQMSPLLAGQLAIWQPDLITFVPSGFRKMHERGYNPSELLARELSKACLLPCAPLLQKAWFSKQQSFQPQAKRARNAEKSFLLRKNLMIEGKNIVIIDDVVTTGATVSACAGLLRDAGAGKIYTICTAIASNRQKI